VTDDPRAEDDIPRGSTVARFFLVPLLVVVTAVGIFFAFSLLTFEKRTPADYLQEVRGGSDNRRWQAAFELSRSIGSIPPGPERDKLAAEALRVFQGLTGRRPEDATARRYLVLVLGKLGDPAAAPALLAAVKDPDPDTRLYAVWALGVLRDRRALETVVEASKLEDGGMRKMAAYVLGQIGDRGAVPRLQVLLGDRVADVRWNAAIALAQLNDRSGLPVLRTMIDRETLAGQAALSSDQAETAMVGALKAFALLKDTESLPAIEKVAREDPNLRVREAAQRAAEATRPKASSVLERPPRDLVG
jgi:HEAT repeat protein